MKDTVLDAERILITLPLISTPFGADAIDVDNVTLRCKTQAKHQQIGVDWELQCVASCDGGRYRSDIKSTEISLKKNERGQLKGKSLVSPCVPCPVGINCDDEGPLPLPNYWGYTDKEGKIRMMRCPEDYCCKGGHCQNLTSCAEGRTGTLCGQCETNTTESLFSAACISANQCQTLFVAVCLCTGCPSVCSISSPLQSNEESSIAQVEENLEKTEDEGKTKVEKRRV